MHVSLPVKECNRRKKYGNLERFLENGRDVLAHCDKFDKSYKLSIYWCILSQEYKFAFGKLLEKKRDYKGASPPRMGIFMRKLKYSCKLENIFQKVKVKNSF